MGKQEQDSGIRQYRKMELFFGDLKKEEIEFEQKLAKNYYLDRFIPAPGCKTKVNNSKNIQYGWPKDEQKRINLLKGDGLLPLAALNPIPLNPKDLKLTEVSPANLIYNRLLFRSFWQLKKYVDLHKEHLERLEKVIVDEIITNREKLAEGEIIEKKEVKPKDEWEWIEREYDNNRDNFNNDSEWADYTLTKFQKEFNTPQGSPDSMKRYGKYEGRY